MDWQLPGIQGVKGSGHHSLMCAPVASTTPTAGQGQEHQSQGTDQRDKAEAHDSMCPAQRPQCSLKTWPGAARQCSPILSLLGAFRKRRLAWLHVPSSLTRPEMGVRSSSRDTGISRCGPVCAADVYAGRGMGYPVSGTRLTDGHQTRDQEESKGSKRQARPRGRHTWTPRRARPGQRSTARGVLQGGLQLHRVVFLIFL